MTRSRTVLAVLLVVIAVMAVVSLCTGDFRVTPREVFTALFMPGDGFETVVVREWRLPRVLMAVVMGGALGVSGAIFQSLTRNPLGSPDIIGISAGAYTGALVMITVVGSGSGFAGVGTGAFVGCVASAVAVYLLAYRGGVQGFRLVIVGIAVSAMLFAFNTWLITRARLEEALVAAVWGIGSLNAVGWSQALPATIVIALTVPLLAYQAKPMRMMEMGDDAAIALGVRVETSRRVLILLGVLLTAISVAVSGPVSFVALAAPQLAKKLARTPHIAMWHSAVVGAALMIVSDWIAQHAFGSIQLPVGSITVCLGGMYLLWLLSREVKKQ